MSLSLRDRDRKREMYRLTCPRVTRVVGRGLEAQHLVLVVPVELVPGKRRVTMLGDVRFDVGVWDTLMKKNRLWY